MSQDRKEPVILIIYKARTVLFVLFLILGSGTATRAEVYHWFETTPEGVDPDPQMIGQHPLQRAFTNDLSRRCISLKNLHF